MAGALSGPLACGYRVAPLIPPARVRRIEEAEGSSSPGRAHLSGSAWLPRQGAIAAGRWLL